MWSIFKVILLVTTISLVAQPGEGAKQRRIIGGTVLVPKELRSLVAFIESSSNNISFGGTLVSSRTVLTAAHNLKAIELGAKKSKYKVLIGAFDLKKTYDSSHVYSIDSYKLFKSATKLEPPDDIALIYLDRKYERENLKDTAAIGHVTSLYPEDMKECYIAGWGLTKGDGQWSRYPKRAKVQLIYPQNECGKAVEEITAKPEIGYPPLPYGYLPESLCFKGLNGNQCHGDSGGPVYCQHPDEDYKTQIGVISTTFGKGDGCGLELSVASSASAHHRWINDNLEPN